MRSIVASIACRLLGAGAGPGARAGPAPAAPPSATCSSRSSKSRPSPAAPPNSARLTTLLTAEFRKAGITNVVVKDHDDTQTLIARWPAARPSGKKPIVLMAHMDVVEAKASDWQNPPFEFREKDGYYLGRGVADNKGELAGIVLALQELRRQGFQPTRDIIVLFTGDEETAMHGVRRASTEWRPLIDAEYGAQLRRRRRLGVTRTAGSRAGTCRSPRRPTPTTNWSRPTAAATAPARARTMRFTRWPAR